MYVRAVGGGDGVQKCWWRGRSYLSPDRKVNSLVPRIDVEMQIWLRSSGHDGPEAA